MKNSVPVIFLLIEYNIIPIGGFLYNFLLRDLYSREPITAKKKYGADNCRGLELMAVLSYSVLARGLSVLAHNDWVNLYPPQMHICLLLGAVFIIELIILNYFTSKVREWGISDKKSRYYTSYTAIFYWIVLCILIILSANGDHIGWHIHTQVLHTIDG